MSHNELAAWEAYRDAELAEVVPLLEELGFTLDPEQPHTRGERYLMQAVTTLSGRKLILLGTRKSDGQRVVIKIARDPAGRKELAKERLHRKTVERIRFAYQIFFSPDELAFVTRGERTISVQAFIEQERTFLERPLKEQFDLALRSFKAQEGAHATTYAHVRTAKRFFGERDARKYLSAFERFMVGIGSHYARAADVQPSLARARRMLRDGHETIDRYSGFLTHTDFVPHNFRIAGDTLYLLDHSSLAFGNKYEGWARFINFMALYHPALASALLAYVRENRTPEESDALMLMRVYRLGEILWYYVQTLEKSTGDLRALNEARITFWAGMLEAVLDGRELDTETIESYKNLRDSLRSEDEKRRQQGLH